MNPPSPPEISLQLVDTPDSVALVRVLFLEYQASLTVDLCFQGFNDELSGLPGLYAEPSARLLLAQVNDTLAGCGGFRPLLHSDHVNACEMKRLYVRPEFRGLGIGRLLVERLMGDARLAGYTTMLLDTLSDMETARSLYRQTGFIEIAPYYLNPIPGAHYLKADL